MKTFLVKYLIATHLIKNSASARTLLNSLSGDTQSAVSHDNNPEPCYKCYDYFTEFKQDLTGDCMESCLRLYGHTDDICQTNCECLYTVEQCCTDLFHCIPDTDTTLIEEDIPPPSPREDEEVKDRYSPPPPREDEEVNDRYSPPPPREDEEVKDRYSPPPPREEDVIAGEEDRYSPPPPKSFDTTYQFGLMCRNKCEKVITGKITSAELDYITDTTILPNDDVIEMKDDKMVRLRDERIVIDTRGGEPAHLNDTEIESLREGKVIEHHESGELIKLSPDENEVIRVSDGMPICVDSEDREDIKKGVPVRITDEEMKRLNNGERVDVDSGVELIRDEETNTIIRTDTDEEVRVRKAEYLTDEDVEKLVNGEVLEDKEIRLIEGNIVSVSDTSKWEDVEVNDEDKRKIRDTMEEQCIELCNDESLKCIERCNNGHDTSCMIKCSEESPVSIVDAFYEFEGGESSGAVTLGVVAVVAFTSLIN